MLLQLRRDLGSLKKSECFALLAPVALSFLSMAGNGILSLWAVLSIPYVLLALFCVSRDLRELETGDALPLTPMERMAARYLLCLLLTLAALVFSGCSLLLYNGPQGRFALSELLFLEALVFCVSLVGFSLACPCLLLLRGKGDLTVHSGACVGMFLLYEWFFRRTGILISSGKHTLLRGIREALVPEAIGTAAANAQPYLLPAVALSAAVFLTSWLVSIRLFAWADEKIRMW